MQLNTLERFDAKTANAILAAAALSQEDMPYLSASHGKYDAEVRELISELEGLLELSRNDEAGKKKLRAYLSKEVRNALLGEKSADKIRERLGQRGNLPISSYRLKLDKKALKDFQESAKTIEAAMRSPDEVQHFSGSGAFNELVRGATFVTKWIPSVGGEAHWLLADAQRRGDHLDVQSIVRVSPTRIDLSNVENPIDLLRAFVGHYGREFSVKGLGGGHKFLSDVEIAEAPDSSNREITNPSKFTKYFETGYDVNKVFEPTQEIVERDCRIVVAYTIDMVKYLSEKPRA